MTQDATTAQPSPEAIAQARELNAALKEAVDADAVVRGQATELEKLEGRVTQLRLKVNDLEARRNQVAEQYTRATDVERRRLTKTISDARHDLTAAQIELDMTNRRYERALAQSRQGAEPKIATVAPPPQRPLFTSSQVEDVGVGVFLLMLPLVLALARRIWVRAGRPAAAVGLESGPRLQRIEQAVESIAIEVERIGEAQRFTTRLLTERQAEPVAGQIPPMPSARKDPGTITPH
jgi:chromosome segregation ATPase